MNVNKATNTTIPMAAITLLLQMPFVPMLNISKCEYNILNYCNCNNEVT